MLSHRQQLSSGNSALRILAPPDPVTALKSGQTPALKHYTRSLEPRPPLALRLPVTRKFCGKRPGEHLGGEDDSWCAWTAWAGKDREGRRRQVLRAAVAHLHRSHTATGLPASGGLRCGRGYCLLRAGLTKAEEVLSRERASVQAGLTVLSPGTQMAG